MRRTKSLSKDLKRVIVFMALAASVSACPEEAVGGDPTSDGAQADLNDISAADTADIALDPGSAEVLGDGATEVVAPDAQAADSASDTSGADTPAIDTAAVDTAAADTLPADTTSDTSMDAAGGDVAASDPGGSDAGDTDAPNPGGSDVGDPSEVTDGVAGGELGPDSGDVTASDSTADGAGPCPVFEGVNESGTFAQASTSAGPVYLLNYVPSASYALRAVDFFTRAEVAGAGATVEVYPDLAGEPEDTTPLASGALNAGATLEWYTAPLSGAVELTAGTSYWISFEPTDAIGLPWAESGDPVTYVWGLGTFGDWIDLGGGPFLDKPWMVRFKDCFP